jgi:hypothetical protein
MTDDTDLPPAYSRVTDPERFAPLHGYALELLSSLAMTFDVETIEQHGLDPHLETTGVKRPSIRLVPNDHAAAPITVSFTNFPGLRMRFGQRCTAAFPECGCDACGETPDVESARFNALVDAVTHGRFTESLIIDRGEALVEWQTSSAAQWQRQRTAIEANPSPHPAIDRGPWSWKPWPLRSRAL